jgi:hypothetical protein
MNGVPGVVRKPAAWGGERVYLNGRGRRYLKVPPRFRAVNTSPQIRLHQNRRWHRQHRQIVDPEIERTAYIQAINDRNARVEFYDALAVRRLEWLRSNESRRTAAHWLGWYMMAWMDLEAAQ